MSITGETHTDRLEKSLQSPLWDESFWGALTEGETLAKENLEALYEEACEGGGCSCDTCVVRTVLEAIWPVMTEQLVRLIAINQPAQVMGGCGKGSSCCKSE